MMSDSESWDFGNWFVALRIDASGWPAQPAANAPTALRLYSPEDLHLTVAFLGRLEAAQVETVLAEMHRVKSKQLRQFRVQLGKLLLLPAAQRYSAVSFGLRDSAEADEAARDGKAIAAETIDELRPRLYQVAGVKGDSRPPLPHITIGRPPRRASDAERREIADWAANVKPPNDILHISELALYCWSPDRSKRQFYSWHSQKLN